MNKKRPCIIYSSDEINRWDCVVILPLKTLKEVTKKWFSVILPKDNINNLDVDSYTNITDIRSISKKRISKYIWKLTEKNISNIDQKMLKYFKIKKKTPNK